MRVGHPLCLANAQGRVGAIEEGRASFAADGPLAERAGDQARHMMIVSNLAYHEPCAGEHLRGLVEIERLIALAATYRSS